LPQWQEENDMAKRLLALFAALAILCALFAPGAAAAGKTLNYVCTWQKQETFPSVRDALHDAHLFGENGWANSDALYPEAIRGDFLFLLDDGWDLPYTSNPDWEDWFSSFVLDEEKFPGYGDSPRERLKTMADKVRACGWQGLGLWVAMDEHTEEYWRERLEWCKYAGIAYWKVDWGNRNYSDAWRGQLSRLAKEIYPALVIEHASVTGPINDQNGLDRNNGGTYRDWAYRLSYSDVFRTYDYWNELATATTMDRVAGLLRNAYAGNAMNLINAEDNLYMCAALGLTAGVMRFRTEGDYGNDFDRSRPLRHCLAEIERLALWQRLAPAFRADAYPILVSDEILSDSHYMGWTWHEPSSYRTVTQSAPAAITRGIALPTVTAGSGDKPFLVAARNPNGAISVAALGRTGEKTHYRTNPVAHVALEAGDLTGMIGIFGIYGSLTLTFSQSIEGKAILAQDLKADALMDITARVAIDGNSISLPGELITEIGTAQNPAGDKSEPGLLLLIGSEEDFIPAPATRTVKAPFTSKLRGSEIFRSPDKAQWLDAGMWQGGWPKRISYYCLFFLLFPPARVWHWVSGLYS